MTDILTGLNDKQQEAVEHFEGPLLILAGAGSGKTRVLTHRIAYLIEEHQINPFQILALTFTNKAANEMRERVDQIVSYGAGSVWVSTFHSTCVRILRRFIDHIGYDRSFTIYDADDQKSLMKDICKHMNIDTKKFREKTFLNAISNAKNELKTPEIYADEVAKQYDRKIFGDVYKEYQKRLKQNNALDFDDLIMKTVELFETQAEVLEQYQNRFRFLLVDEYQDTNTAQFKLLALLAGKYRNLCVVGDDDQSIYKFRGANIMNILNFEKIFPDAVTIRLEQNYRSTKRILDAANEVIRHNTERKAKSLWTKAEEGEPIRFVQFRNEYEEAAGIASDIKRETNLTNQNNSNLANQNNSDLARRGYSDFAILYRTNAQSRIFEEKLVQENIPYRIVGAINFYARKEIKDLLCYLKAVSNSDDDIAIKRIINVPRRGIGATTVSRVTDYSIDHEISFFEALRQADYIDGCSRAASRIHSFVSFIDHLKQSLDEPGFSLKGLLEEIIDSTGYVKELEAEDTVEAGARLENIDSLMNKVIQFENDAAEDPSGEPATLDSLLENIALVADIDTVDSDAEQVLLMTLHSAKGLEFPHVYICGMEEGVFPGSMAVYDPSPEEMEEERRLCYVGITRAMKKLTLTCAMRRMRNGEPDFNLPSRFISEIPRHLIKQSDGEYETPVTRTIEPTGRTQTEPFSGTPARPFGSTPAQPSAWSAQTSARPGAGKKQRAVNSKNPFADNPYIQKGKSLFAGQGTSSPAAGLSQTASAATAGAPDYKAGDTVYHMKFGTGTVVSLERKSNDYEVVVTFNDFGQRKLRSSFAKLTKI